MATVNIAVTSKTTFSIDYTFFNNDTTIGVTITAVRFTNSRSGGTTAKVYCDVGLDIDNTSSYTYYQNTAFFEDVAVAKGTKGPKTIWSGSKTISWTKTKASTPLKVVLWGYMDDAKGTYDYDEWYKDVQLFNGNVIKSNYTIAYNGNGATGGSTGAQTKWYGENLALQGNGFSRTNFNFVRWNTNTVNTGTGYAPGATYTGNAGMTLYAIWQRTISYNLNATTGNPRNLPSSQTSLATSAMTIMAVKPVRDKYNFRNWNTAAAGNGTAYASGGTYPAGNGASYGNVTLYAQWDPWVQSVGIGDAKAIRVSDTSQSTEANEGLYAYITVPFNIVGAAAATATLTVSGGPAVTYVTQTATKPQGETNFTGTLIARINSQVPLSTSYTLIATVTVTNTTSGVTQSAVTASKQFMLAKAFYTIDLMAGGRGMSIGSPSIGDHFNVSMPLTHYEHTMFPIIGIPPVADLATWTPPSLPCIGLALDRTWWIYESGTWSVNLNSSWQEVPGVIGLYRSYSNKGVQNSIAICTLTITGYSTFTLMIRSYAESCCDYVIAGRADTSITKTADGTSPASISNMQGHTQNKSSATEWTPVVYTGLAGGTHTIDVAYRKDGSVDSNDDCGYFYVPIQ